MDNILNYILSSIVAHGAMSVFWGVILESIIVPIPSPIVIMFAGSVLIPTNIEYPMVLYLLFWKIVLPGSIASTIGAYFLYALFYYATYLKCIKKFFFISDREVSYFLPFMSKYIGIKIFLLRVIPIVPLSIISAISGLLHVRKMDFIIYTFLGSVVRCFILGWMGYAMINTYRSFSVDIDYLEGIVSIVILICFFLVILNLRSKFKSKK